MSVYNQLRASIPFHIYPPCMRLAKMTHICIALSWNCLHRYPPLVHDASSTGHRRVRMGYEAAALQALIALQTLFGFVIVDDSLHTLLLYRTIA